MWRLEVLLDAREYSNLKVCRALLGIDTGTRSDCSRAYMLTSRLITLEAFWVVNTWFGYFADGVDVASDVLIADPTK